MGCTKEPTVEFANTPAPQLIHNDPRPRDPFSKEEVRACE